MNGGAISSAGEQPDQIGTLIGEIQKNSRERLRITVGQYKGHEYVGIRVWFVDKDGQYRPSKNGVTLRPALLPELMQSLGLAARAADPDGVR